MCLFTSALRASVNKLHIPSLPQNNLYISGIFMGHVNPIIGINMGHLNPKTWKKWDFIGNILTQHWDWQHFPKFGKIQLNPNKITKKNHLGNYKNFPVKEILNSLHLSVFNWTLFSEDQDITLFAIFWAWLAASWWTISDVVVSSTYFQIPWFSISKSFIIRMKSHGPNFFPCGTPEGTMPHSE